MANIRRIKKEAIDLSKDPPRGVSAGPKNATNLHKWVATIEGPQGTPYAGGLFQLDIEITQKYPFEAPKIRFVTPIYHCNISRNGEICLDILKDQWTPSLTISQVLLSLSSLLNDPNPDDPLVPDIARQYKSNRLEHDRTAAEYTRKNALNI